MVYVPWAAPLGWLSPLAASLISPGLAPPRLVLLGWLDKFDPIWTGFVQVAQVRSNLDRFDPIWTGFIQFGQV